MSIPDQIRQRRSYLSTVELCELTGICRKTVERMVRSGKLKAVKILNGYKFDPEVVATFLESRQTS